MCIQLCQGAVVTVVGSCNYLYLYIFNWLTVTENSDLDALNIVSVIYFFFVCVCEVLNRDYFFFNYSLVLSDLIVILLLEKNAKQHNSSGEYL